MCVCEHTSLYVYMCVGPKIDFIHSSSPLKLYFPTLCFERAFPKHRAHSSLRLAGFRHLLACTSFSQCWMLGIQIWAIVSNFYVSAWVADTIFWTIFPVPNMYVLKLEIPEPPHAFFIELGKRVCSVTSKLFLLFLDANVFFFYLLIVLGSLGPEVPDLLEQGGEAAQCP